MCGVVGYCKVNNDDVCGVFEFLEEYAQAIAGESGNRSLWESNLCSF